MRKNVMAKNLRQSIKKSIGRYIAILAIIALGAGIFVGLRTTKSDMVATGQKYMDHQNMFDLRLLNSYGWNTEHVEAIAGMEGVVCAEGMLTVDAVVRFQGEEDESVVKIHSIPKSINKVCLQGGRLPQSPDECLADGFHATDAILGTSITVMPSNEDTTLDMLAARTFTVVGYVSSPLYMDMSRGNTSLGSGSIRSFVYVPKEAFISDYYTEIHVTVAADRQVYTQQYHDTVERWGERLTAELEILAQNRYADLRAEAEKAYDDGLREYDEGLREYEEGKREGQQQLLEARKELGVGQRELEDGIKQLEEGKQTVLSGQEEIEKNRELLDQSKLTLAQTKAQTYTQLAQANASLLSNYKTVNDSLRQVEDGLSQIDSALSQIDSGISQLETGISTTQVMISVTQSVLNVTERNIQSTQTALEAAKKAGADAAVIADLESRLAEMEASKTESQQQLAEMEQNLQTYTLQLEQLKTQRQELSVQREELVATQRQLQDALATIDAGFLELQNSRAQVENEFAAAEAKLEAAQLQFEIAEKELQEGLKEIEASEAQLDEACNELASGWEAYYTGEWEFVRELTDGKKALQDARTALEEGKQQLEEMEAPEVYTLGRTTNAGYLALDNNSDIVEGVAAVFPAFFLLIAALVCITTMTRMVEEERTQIGTLKALGYGQWSIIAKYLAYAGSAAVIGCSVGVLAGSAVFPMILWEAYGIILNLETTLVLRLDWTLILLVVGAYTAVTLFVTWYSCRMVLREVPAELIRPKPPTSGKKIFLEHLPFWDRFSFLNKVMLRNVFRYRQRLLMMLVGIGGCTALLLTGFGLRDSIVDIVSYQFQQVTLYDLEVRFSQGQTDGQMESFRNALAEEVEDICFYHQSSVDLDFDQQTKQISLIAAQGDIDRFIRMRDGKRELSIPGKGEALLSVGTAEALGIRVGDTVSVRNTDMRNMQLKIVGIYDNHVNNYILINPETAEQLLGEPAQKQMACVTVKKGFDPSEVGAGITGMEDVMTVSVSQEIAKTVGSMLEALDLVVITVVICAALLAIIVLYNLTNINITERIREIATIKVLGFRSWESAAYVFKENILLSVMGMGLGLGGGLLLLKYVVSQIRIDMVWLEPRLQFGSYIWAIVITILSACFVDFLLFFKLEKINMAEALKSVE